MIEELTDEDEEGFRSGRECVDQIFTLKQFGKKEQNKKAECM